MAKAFGLKMRGRTGKDLQSLLRFSMHYGKVTHAHRQPGADRAPLVRTHRKAS